MPHNIKSLEDWLNSPKVSEALKGQLRELQAKSQAGDPEAREALEDSLSQELKFGTSGLRGIMGAGNNRMNFHTVAKATQGLAIYLLKHYKDPLVCIAYDSRNMSRRFAEGTAMVLCANGIRVQMFAKLRPTPMLSYAIRKLKAAAGVVITASHNPRQYNGYKVYNSFGGQITGSVAGEILDCIGTCDLFESPKFMSLQAAQEKGLFRWINHDLERSYYDKVKLLVRRKAMVAEYAPRFHIIYTPLYGTGAEPVSQVLSELGFRMDYVAEQMRPNGDFPTTPYPNPEKEPVYKIAREISTKNMPDLIIATDPDCDRIGVSVRDQYGQYRLLTGNQIGLLMCHYLLEQMKEKQQKNTAHGTVYSTVVSTDLLEKICRSNGVKYEALMPGFKYISEKIEALEKSYPGSFIFGMEESNGYLLGDVSRDKDGVISALLVAEMGLYYKEKSMTLLEALNSIYEQWGYCLEETLFFAMPGQKGQRQIRQIMNRLRCFYSLQKDQGPSTEGCSNASAEEQTVAAFSEQAADLKLPGYLAGGKPITEILPDVVGFKDYLLGIDNLPAGNVIKLYFADNSWLAMRPSGTEAKLKIYLSAKGEDAVLAQMRLLRLKQAAMELVGPDAVLADDDEG